MQNQNLNLFRPRRVAAKIHYSMISQFMFCFDVENNDTADMMRELNRELGVEIIDL